MMNYDVREELVRLVNQDEGIMHCCGQASCETPLEAQAKIMAIVEKAARKARIEELKQVKVQRPNPEATDWSAHYYIKDRIAELQKEDKQ